MTKEQKTIIEEFVDAFKVNIEEANMGSSNGRDAYYDIVRYQYVNEEFEALKELMNQKEKRVYVINNGDVNIDFNFNELLENKQFEEIMKEAEILGSVYSLEGFQLAINNEELFLSESYILIN